jgi:hypothetical protein
MAVAIEDADRFGEIDALDLLDEIQDIAAGIAAEAMETLDAILPGEDGEGWGLVGMEGAAGYMFMAVPLQPAAMMRRCLRQRHIAAKPFDI